MLYRPKYRMVHDVGYHESPPLAPDVLRQGRARPAPAATNTYVTQLLASAARMHANSRVRNACRRVGRHLQARCRSDRDTALIIIYRPEKKSLGLLR